MLPKPQFAPAVATARSRADLDVLAGLPAGALAAMAAYRDSLRDRAPNRRAAWRAWHCLRALARHGEVPASAAATYAQLARDWEQINASLGQGEMPPTRFR